MAAWELVPVAGRAVPRRGSVLAGALLVLALPALHPLLRPLVGVPSHLLWFAHILPVALISYQFGLRGALAAILGSASWVAVGERLFGAGYGIGADEATVVALSSAVGFTNALVAAFALAVRSQQARRRDLGHLVTAALGASAEAVLVLDAGQTIRYANEAARQLFGTRVGQLAGSPFDRLLADQAGTPGTLIEWGRGAEAVPVVARTVEGRPFAAELSVSPVRDGRQPPLGYLVTVRDQSERVRREQARRRSQTLAELGATIASIAHELNNPLASVVAYAQLLQESPGLPAQAATDLETIAHEARRAASIARQLLDLVRRGERPRELVDLNQLVERTVKSRSASFAAHGIRVRFEPAAALPPVCVVPGEIEQILVNLLVNAEQAMHSAHGGGVLEIRTGTAGTAVEVQVADDGPGIAPEHLPRLFESFFTTKPVGVGTGLGLAIARRIAREHGGDLLAASAPGRGAEFVLRLPAAADAASGPPALPEPAEAPGPALLGAPGRPPAVAAAAPDSSGHSVPPGAPGARPPATQGRATRILVVEDEPALRSSLERLLRRRGCEVAAVAEVDGALECLGRQSFDLVLCDLHLGAKSGIQLYQEAVRRYPALRDRFLFVTGDVLSLEVREFLESSGVPELAKPFELAELWDRIARLTGVLRPTGPAPDMARRRDPT